MYLWNITNFSFIHNWACCCVAFIQEGWLADFQYFQVCHWLFMFVCSASRLTNSASIQVSLDFSRLLWDRRKLCYGECMHVRSTKSFFKENVIVILCWWYGHIHMDSFFWVVQWVYSYSLICSSIPYFHFSWW